MDGVFNTLQEFMSHTEGVTYVLILVILVGLLGFWRFLVERDQD